MVALSFGGLTQTGAIVAQSVDPTGAWGPLLQVGAVGCILAWVLIRLEPRLGRVERAIDRNSRTILLAMVANPSTSAVVKEQARMIKDEIDAARKARGDEE